MTKAVITAEVYSVEEGAVYRLYINSTLMSEHIFRRPVTENFIQESVILDGPPGEYTVYVTPASVCRLKNVLVNGSPSNYTFVIR